MLPTREQAEELLKRAMEKDPYVTFGDNRDKKLIEYFKSKYPLCDFMKAHVKKDQKRLCERYGQVGSKFHACTLLQMYESNKVVYLEECKSRCEEKQCCNCSNADKEQYIKKLIE